MKLNLSAREKSVIIFSDVKRIEDLKALTIRQLKALASRINKELGQVIVKALFGKVMSNMTKAELIDAIWSVKVCRNQTAMYDSELVAISNRIYEFNYCSGAPGYDHWITYFGFNKSSEGSAEQNAERFRQWLLKNGHCRLAAIRWRNELDKATGQLKPNSSFRIPSDKFEFEVKVWGIKNTIFDKLVIKETKAKEQEMKKPIIPLAERPLEEQREALQRQYDLAKSNPLTRSHAVKNINLFGFELVNEIVDYRF